MRHPARIYPLLNKIGDIWIKHPDLRFGQLIEIISSGHPCGHNGFDPFYIEDEEFEKLIDLYNKKQKYEKK